MTRIEFNTFWDAYGLKRDRKAAEGAWKRLSAKDRQAAFDGIHAYREECRRTGVRMMYGQGYLNHRRWEDEIDPVNTVTDRKTENPSQKDGNPSSPMLW